MYFEELAILLVADAMDKIYFWRANRSPSKTLFILARR
jgi:hypothetical protein